VTQAYAHVIMITLSWRPWGTWRRMLKNL